MSEYEIQALAILNDCKSILTTTCVYCFGILACLLWRIVKGIRKKTYKSKED